MENGKDKGVRYVNVCGINDLEMNEWSNRSPIRGLFILVTGKHNCREEEIATYYEEKGVW